MAWPPSVDDLRARSAILAEAFPSPAGDAGLQGLMEEIGAVVSSITSRVIFVTPTGSAPSGCAYELVPPELQPVATRAIRLMAEIDQVSAGSRSDVIERTAEGLASFSAGVYSESYFAPGSATSGQSPEYRLNADPEVSAALWALLTECARSYWLYVLDPTRPREPASSLEEFDWFPESPVPFWPPYL